jgi:hypothetical protein
MKRWTIQVCVFLLLGAIVNVAVAWGCVWISWPRGDLIRARRTAIFGQSARMLDPATADAGWLRSFGWKPRDADQCHRFPIEIVERHWLGRIQIEHAEAVRPNTSICFGHGGPCVAHIVTLVNMGWPMSALGGEQWTDYNQAPSISGTSPFVWEQYPRKAFGAMSVTRHAWLAGTPFEINELLAWRPIWPGFAINTLLYAALLWGLFAAPLALRRRRRVRRGLCPACAYPVGESDICTECGKPVRVRRVEPASP